MGSSGITARVYSGLRGIQDIRRLAGDFRFFPHNFSLGRKESRKQVDIYQHGSKDTALECEGKY